jgi:DNA-binding CsgD family transcriptional regulator
MMHESLSSTELTILFEIAHGLTTNDIAQKYHISKHTIKFHRANIRWKMGVRTIPGAVGLAYREGILDGQGKLF